MVKVATCGTGLSRTRDLEGLPVGAGGASNGRGGNGAAMAPETPGDAGLRVTLPLDGLILLQNRILSSACRRSWIVDSKSLMVKAELSSVSW